MAHRFQNLNPEHRPATARMVFKWAIWDRLTGARRSAPPGPPAPAVPLDLARLAARDSNPSLTWLGHCSFWLRLGGESFLFDPVLTPRVGFFYPRFGPAPAAPAALPATSAVVVSHGHYDHLDEWTLRRLNPPGRVVAPLGLGAWFRKRGFAKVEELGWWQSLEVGSVRLTLVPARHWTRRTPWDTNTSWWGGYVLEAAGRSVYFCGDSAWFDAFPEIGRRFPGLDVAILPIGGYAPAWFMSNNHLSPEEAGRAFLDLGARRLVPMHWGTFQLTDEPLCEPAARLRSWWEKEGPRDGRELEVMAVGETVGVNQDSRGSSPNPAQGVAQG